MNVINIDGSEYIPRDVQYRSVVTLIGQHILDEAKNIDKVVVIIRNLDGSEYINHTQMHEDTLIAMATRAIQDACTTLPPVEEDEDEETP